MKESAIVQRRHMLKQSPYLPIACLFLLAAINIPAQTPSASSVLVVYALNDTGSTFVGAYYAAQRAVPPSNLWPCDPAKLHRHDS